MFEQPALESNCYVTTSTTIGEDNTDGAMDVGVDVEAKCNFSVDVVVTPISSNKVIRTLDAV